MKCQDVQEKLWCAEMTEEMLDHLAGCESCSAEWKLIQGVGMSVEQMEVPMQTKSLLPPREVMEEVVQSVRKKRRTGYVSGGVAAACLLLAFWQGPDFWRSGPAGIASQAETAKAPGEKAVSELAGAAKSSSPESLQRDVLEPRGNGMLGTEAESTKYDKRSGTANGASATAGQPLKTQVSQQDGEVASDRANVEQAVQTLLKEHGWTEKSGVPWRTYRTTLPNGAYSAPGEYPLGLYWAYRNEFSRKLGYDMSKLWGRNVFVHAVTLNETTPTSPNGNAVAMFVTHGGQVAGVWMNWPGDDRTRSLDGRTEAAVLSGTTWGQWLKQEDLIRYDEPSEAQWRALAAEEVLRQYYDAVNKQDFKTAYAHLSKRAQHDLLTAGGGLEDLFADGWQPAGMQPMNLMKAELMELTDAAKTSDGSQAEAAEVREFAAKVDQTYRDQSFKDGAFTWTIRMVKETADAPWKVDRYSVTGP